MASKCSVLVNGQCVFEKSIFCAALWSILNLNKLGQIYTSVNFVFQNFIFLVIFGLLVLSVKREYIQISPIGGFNYLFFEFCPFCFMYFKLEGYMQTNLRLLGLPAH